MAKKVKDYYDLAYCERMGDKLRVACEAFDSKRFMSLVRPTLEGLEFGDRQILIAEALYACLPKKYEDALAVFYRILGPELEGSLGMFSEGYWLWPIGKYVELYGSPYFEESTAFSKELTKRFTGEFCMRPILEAHPERTMRLMRDWSLDENKRVRRLASECLRIRLPWAKKTYVALAHFDIYTEVLSNLRNDEDKTIQKSVANNLNDLYKEDPEKFSTIIRGWERGEVSKPCAWIIKHASRTMAKKNAAASGLNK